MIRFLRHHPLVVSWRRSCANHDPLTIAAGLLVWGLTVWWLLPAFSRSPGSLIDRIVQARLPLPLVQAVLVSLALLLTAGLFACQAWLTRLAAYTGLVWWTLVWAIAVAQQPTSTSTGSYAIVVTLSGIYLHGTALRDPVCRE